MDSRAVGRMQPDRFHPEREQRDDDLLDGSRRPRPGEMHDAAVVADRLVAVLLPDDVGRRQRHLRRDADVGQPVVEEGEVVEDVLARLAPVDVHPQAGRPGRHLLRQLQLVAHLILSRWTGVAGQATGSGVRRGDAQRWVSIAAVSAKWSWMTASVTEASRSRSAARTGAWSSAIRRRSTPGTTIVIYVREKGSSVFQTRCRVALPASSMIRPWKAASAVASAWTSPSYADRRISSR